MKQCLIVTLLMSVALVSSPSLAQDARAGADGYKLCAGCHGFEGEGNQLVNAPALAGVEDWYLKRQLVNFRDGVRGTAESDQHGRMMAMMSYGLKDDEDIDDIVAHIGTMPVRALDSHVDGDAARGKTLYASCATCHGANAEGNTALNAPALTTLDDWYQLVQLENFRNGNRGANPADIYGMQMVPMANALPDDAAVRDVVAYISSLTRAD